jgi:hypothetical protein
MTAAIPLLRHLVLQVPVKHSTNDNTENRHRLERMKTLRATDIAGLATANTALAEPLPG